MSSFIDNRPSGFTAIEPLIKEAKIARMWIYNKHSKNWYTPEEFEAMYKDRKLDYSSGQSMIKEYVIKDPRTGLRDRIALLKRTHQEIEAFSEKIFSYYQLK